MHYSRHTFMIFELCFFPCLFFLFFNFNRLFLWPYGMKMIEYFFDWSFEPSLNEGNMEPNRLNFSYVLATFFSNQLSLFACSLNLVFVVLVSFCFHQVQRKVVTKEFNLHFNAWLPSRLMHLDIQLKMPYISFLWNIQGKVPHPDRAN